MNKYVTKTNITFFYNLKESTVFLQFKIKEVEAVENLRWDKINK